MAQYVTISGYHQKRKQPLLRAFVVMVLLLLMGVSTLQAQEKISPDSPNRRPVLAIHAGIHGFGVGLSKGITQHWSMALDYTYMEAGAEFSADLMGFRFVNSPYLKAQTASISGRYSLRPNGRFSLAAGLTWMDWNMEYGVANANALQLGTMVFTREELGQAKINSSNTWSLAPYLGIHLGRANPKSRISMAFDLGMFYTNGQNLKANGTGLSSSINKEEQKLQDNFSTYKVLPQINFQIRCKL